RGFGDLPWKEFFAAVWTGVVRLPKDGQYSFYLKANYGARLYLDAKLLIDHDGSSLFQESESRRLSLKAGDHDLKIEYFQNEAGRCILSWKAAEKEKQVVPATVLWHKFEKGLDRGTN